jgi:hypothetical protein
MPDAQADLHELDAAIAAQERLRGQLPDAAIDAALAALRAQRAQLASAGAIAQGPGAMAVGAQGVGIAGANYGTINTGVIVNIGGDDIEKNREIARTVLAATLLSPPLERKRKQAIARYYREVAKTLADAAESLRQGVVPHGKCGEMLGHAQQLPAVIGDVIGREQAEALSRKLLEAYQVEQFGVQYMGMPRAERDAKFGQLDEAAGYFRAAARALQVKR